MTTTNDLNTLFPDAELPFGHPGRHFDDTPAHFDRTPLAHQLPDPDYTPDEEATVVHYGPGDRPLCGNESPFAVYTDEPGPSRRLRRMPGARRRGPAGHQRLPRTLSPLPAGNHRPGRGRVAPRGPRSLPALPQTRLVIAPAPSA